MSSASSDEDPSETIDEENWHENSTEAPDSVTARPRDHAYLPTSHPLHTPIQKTVTHPSSARASNTQTLPVLELPGILLFPGSAFPLRFSQSDPWVEYLGQQIASSRQCPGQAAEVRLGILTMKPPPDLERAISMNRRRQSWTRQPFGPDRLRRLSMQLIQELGDLDALSDNEGDVNEHRDRTVFDDTQPAERSSPELTPSHLPTVNNVLNRQKDRCGYIGRIGTIVTVMNTHGDEARNNTDSVWRSVNEDGQLILTTLATKRFRILRYSSTHDEDTMYQRALVRRSHPRSDSVPTFVVEIMDERRFIMPTTPRAISRARVEKRTQKDNVVTSFAMITPFPEFIYRKIWPWRLVSLIREEMKSSHTFRAFSHFLPHADNMTSIEKNDAVQVTLESSDVLPNEAFDDKTEDDPVRISFWLASNLPFPEDDKYLLLEMYSAAERLEYIYRKIKERTEPLICCLCCGLPVSRASSMFTVGGAEGTTGAYVNEHGFVHQTITVRRLLSLSQNQRAATNQSTSSNGDSDIVSFLGGPQTKDSWFPGYSWTIMSCALCDSHLGWKFRRVQRRQDEKPSNERPGVFYGLSGASVTTAFPQ